MSLAFAGIRAGLLGLRIGSFISLLSGVFQTTKAECEKYVNSVLQCTVSLHYQVICLSHLQISSDLGELIEIQS